MEQINLDEIPEREVVPGYFGRFVNTENISISYFHIKAGAEMPKHHHISEQVSNMLEGEFHLFVNGELAVLRPGTVIKIPSDIPHSGIAITDCYIIDVFYPIRENYK